MPEERPFSVRCEQRGEGAVVVVTGEVDMSTSPALREQLYSKCPTVVLTSATLSAGGSNGFGHTQDRLGLTDAKMEAIFLAPEVQRRGWGRLLVDHARRLKGSLTVDVNEQNEEAVAFYKACGFRVVGRSELDSTGRPFPLLHLSEAGV